MPWSPPGPSEPATTPASSVPWRSGRRGIVGCGCAMAPLPGVMTSMPDVTLSRRNGCDWSTPVSSSATTTPRPSSPGTPSPGTEAGTATGTPGLTSVDVGYATRTGYTATTSRSRSSISSEVGSSRAATAFSTRTYRCSAVIVAPLAAIRRRNCSCAARAEATQPRICVSVAAPPSASTRMASDGPRSTTMYRCAVDTSARTPSTPCQPASSMDAICAGASPAASPPRTAASAAAAVAASPAVLRDRGIGVEPEVVG